MNLKYNKLEESEQDSVHDAIYEGLSNKELIDKIDVLFDLIPEDIVELAMEWGWNDTEVGDKVYKFFRNDFKGEMYYNGN